MIYETTHEFDITIDYDYQPNEETVTEGIIINSITLDGLDIDVGRLFKLRDLEWLQHFILKDTPCKY